MTGAPDGKAPYAELLLSSNVLYGTTAAGGISNKGTVFRLNTDGSGYTNVYNFTYGDDGANPNSGLVLLNNALYGTVGFGGSTDQGDAAQPQCRRAISGLLPSVEAVEAVPTAQMSRGPVPSIPA